MAFQLEKVGLVLLKIMLFLTIQMLQAATIMISIAKGKLILFFRSLMLSKTDKFLPLDWQT
jgi:hypothetical protein